MEYVINSAYKSQANIQRHPIYVHAQFVVSAANLNGVAPDSTLKRNFECNIVYSNRDQSVVESDRNIHFFFLFGFLYNR